MLPCSQAKFHPHIKFLASSHSTVLSLNYFKAHPYPVHLKSASKQLLELLASHTFAQGSPKTHLQEDNVRIVSIVVFAFTLLLASRSRSLVKTGVKNTTCQLWQQKRIVSKMSAFELGAENFIIVIMSHPWDESRKSPVTAFWKSRPSHSHMNPGSKPATKLEHFEILFIIHPRSALKKGKIFTTQNRTCLNLNLIQIILLMNLWINQRFNPLSYE